MAGCLISKSCTKILLQRERIQLRLPTQLGQRGWSECSEVEHRSCCSLFLFFFTFCFSCLVSKKTGCYIVHSSGVEHGAQSPMTMAVYSNMAALGSEVVRHSFDWFLRNLEAYRTHRTLASLGLLHTVLYSSKSHRNLIDTLSNWVSTR